LKAVLPYTWRGKILIACLRFLFFLLSIFKGKKWQSPLPDFEENPIDYPHQKEALLYFGYKYYYRPPTLFPKALATHFKEQDLRFPLPEGFQEQSRVSLSVGGDLMPYEWIQKPYTQHLWDELGDFFFDADLVFANLETPLLPSQAPSLVPEVMLEDMLFNASEEMFEIFSGNGHYKGYDVLSTANNHSWDMGEAGLVSTIDFLERRGIAHTGTARSPEERAAFPILERQGIRIAFLAYTYSLNKFELPEDKRYMVNHLRFNRPDCSLEAIKADVALAKARGADLVLLSAHTGNAYQPYPSPHTVAIFHRIFEECGVDAILGGHPHNPQPMERYSFTCPFSGKTKQGFAIYSLSDFVAYDIFVWGKLFPLLKIYIAKGQDAQGQTHTQIADIALKAGYNWGEKNGKKPRQMRFLDLHQTVAALEAGRTPAFLSPLCKQEIQSLHAFWQAYMPPPRG